MYLTAHWWPEAESSSWNRPLDVGSTGHKEKAFATESPPCWQNTRNLWLPHVHLPQSLSECFPIDLTSYLACRLLGFVGGRPHVWVWCSHLEASSFSVH